jgi:endonuclease/exonuclease/phosphatase family metal-dependent hydrolase
MKYKLENIGLATKEIGKIPHIEAVKKYLPEILEPLWDNGFSKTGKVPFTAAIFNMETGVRLKQIIAYFQYLPALRNAEVIFANELDWGMARTGNQDITREFASSLGMNYAYGVEFLTTKAGQNNNTLGLHGNAILSKFPLERVKIVHLPIEYDWFYKEGDSRLGVRNAVLAEAHIGSLGRVGLVSAHLENRTTPEGRRQQLAYLLDQVDAHFGKELPVLIGGDMNTNTVDGNSDTQMQYLADHPGEQWQRIGQIPSWEPQLDYAASRGFAYGQCNVLEKPTRRKPMNDGRTVVLNLDWFYERGLKCSESMRIESIFHCNGLRTPPDEVRTYQGQELSDHDIVLVTCEGLV